MNKLCSFIKKHEFLFVTALCMILVFLVCVANVIGMLILEKDTEHSFEKKLAEESENCTIDFESIYFQKAVSRSLDCFPNDFTEELFLETEVLKITNFSNLTDISDIRLFPNLKKLEIINCDVQDISPLTCLNQLEELNLSSNNIKDISPLSEISTLTVLDVSKNQISDFSPVKNLSKLEIAIVDNNKIENFGNLSQMENLKELSIANNPISDIGFVNTGNLTSLNISFCGVDNLSVLSDCKTLESLYIYGYSKMDLSPLHGLPKLSSLYLDKEFDRTQLKFLEDNFNSGDKYTKIYLVSKKHGLKVARFISP